MVVLYSRDEKQELVSMQKPNESLTRNLFMQEYTNEFVNRWDELINWEKRKEAENGFFENKLAEHNVQSVLDAACGTGFHTITLTNSGFRVIGSDGSPPMLQKAEENAKRAGLQDIPFVTADWCHLTDVFEVGQFDAVVILGNAFTHLFSENDHIQALNEILSLLNEGGVALIDHRNYDKILDRGYESKHQYYYVGDVNVYPEESDEDVMKFKYEYPDGNSFHLTFNPLRQDYMDKLFRQVGFSEVTRYGDFQAEYDHHDPDFILHVAQK